MKLNPNQKSALRMIRNGHPVRKVTFEALRYRGLAIGCEMKPRLTLAGQHVEKHGTPPPANSLWLDRRKRSA